MKWVRKFVLLFVIPLKYPQNIAAIISKWNEKILFSHDSLLFVE